MADGITRRDFLGSTLLGSGAMLMSGLTPAQLLAAADEWSGYGGVGDYARSNGNTFEVLTAGHRMRDNAEPAATIDTGAIDGALGGNGAQFLGSKILELAAVAAERGTRSAHDGDIAGFQHLDFLVLFEIGLVSGFCRLVSLAA